MNNKRLITSIISILVFVGALVLFTSTMNKDNKDSKDTDMPYNKNASFNTMFVLPKGKVVTVGDELEVTLLSVGDSRCPENAKCIWQGEITYKLQISHNENTGNIELGTVNTREEKFEDYEVALDDSNDSTEYVRLIIKN